MLTGSPICVNVGSTTCIHAAKKYRHIKCTVVIFETETIVYVYVYCVCLTFSVILSYNECSKTVHISDENKYKYTYAVH